MTTGGGNKNQDYDPLSGDENGSKVRPAENSGDSHTRAAPEHGAEQRRSRGGDDTAVVLVVLMCANIVMFWFVCGCSDYLQSAAAQCRAGQLRK